MLLGVSLPRCGQYLTSKQLGKKEREERERGENKRGEQVRQASNHYKKLINPTSYLRRCLKKLKERLRFVTQLKRRVLECCVAILGQRNPLNLLQTCKNQQGMLARNATHNNKVKKKLCF